MSKQIKIEKPYTSKLNDELKKSAIAASLMQTPAERLREAVAMTLKEYGVTEEELKNRRKKPLSITIISYDANDNS